MIASGEDVVSVECRECGATVSLPNDGGGRAILAGALDGWEFTIETGWRCPEHVTYNGGPTGG